MENQLATIQNNALLFEPDNLTKETVKKYISLDATDQEIIYFLQICKTFKLNPLKREIYLVKYGNSKANILVGYEVYLKRAERSNKWSGMEVTTEGSIENKDLKAIVKIYRKDWSQPLIHEAYYSEYVQTKADGTPNTFWKNKPRTMIKKVAISQAFRFAFPDEFDGMPYTSDEVVDQEKIIDIVDVAKTKDEQSQKVTLMRQGINNMRSVISESSFNEVLLWHGIADLNYLEDIELGKKIYDDLKKRISTDKK